MPPQTPSRVLLALVVPAVLVGIGSALVLLGLSALAGRLDHLWWHYLPAHGGFAPFSRWWIVVVLAATGLLVGLTVRLVPGHAGPDPATVELGGAPQPLGVLPGVAVAAVLALGGGVSLGPENPITMVNIGWAYWLGRKALPATGAGLWTGLAVAGTIGALFGSPVAAALILSELPAGRGQPAALWDRLFAPLVAATAGAITTLVIAGNDFVIDLPKFPGGRMVDVGWALALGAVSALLGLVVVYAFAPLHALFARVPGGPVLPLLLGGLLLGGLGALGGELTMFKGLDQVKELATSFSSHSAWALLGMCLVKLAALLVAGTCGFRGGRIFPAVFAGVALGCAAHGAVDDIPVALAVACSILGVLLAVTRQGWLSLFTAAAMVQDTRLISFLCVAALPAWLIVTGRTEMELPAAGPAVEAAVSGG
ncbi:ion channel protein [Kitasatospora viridis]|uniref:H+/Cl-antiporter ClcA n=1 Tax=Kitasatospora viridis TaxID=281105 RepID=A0A561UBS2_9ACTN|nr:ion channel protein [Kitasatospora viridis]TWF96810.1 H+/Cl- antiporter ClcA [Kitasatospora viridis]